MWPRYRKKCFESVSKQRSLFRRRRIKAHTSGSVPRCPGCRWVGSRDMSSNIHPLVRSVRRAWSVTLRNDRGQKRTQGQPVSAFSVTSIYYETGDNSRKCLKLVLTVASALERKRSNGIEVPGSDLEFEVKMLANNRSVPRCKG